jgi:hypothetical protein
MNLIDEILKKEESRPFDADLLHQGETARKARTSFQCRSLGPLRRARDFGSVLPLRSRPLGASSTACKRVRAGISCAYH